MNNIIDKSKAYLLTVEGKVRLVEPQNGTDFTCKELYKLIGCDLVEVDYPLANDGMILITDEEAKLKSDWEINQLATQIYGYYPDDVIAGNAVYCPSEMLK